MLAATSNPTLSLHHELNPYVSYDPHAHNTTRERWNKVWVVATVVTALAFTAFAALAVGYATLYLEAYLPIIALVTFLGLHLSLPAVQYPWDKACQHRQEAQLDKKLIEKMQRLDSQIISTRLEKFKIKPGIKPEQLKSVMARFDYLRELEKAHLAKATRLNLSANAIEAVPLKIEGRTIKASPKDYLLRNIDPTDAKSIAIFEAFQIKRSLQQQELIDAALCRLKEAYLLKLMENPHDLRFIGGSAAEGFGELKKMSYPLRLVAQEYNDPSATTIFVTNKGVEYTADTILKKNHTELAKEIFELSPLASRSKWPWSA